MSDDVRALSREKTLLDFDDHPLIAIWETTQACDLVCRQCRACTTPNLDPRALSTAEGKALLDAIHAMGTPLCVLTGGHPAKRADLVELVPHGTALERLAEIAKDAPFQVKTTGAPHFDRVLLSQKAARVPIGLQRDDGIVRGPRGVTDGVGFLFVSHLGDICPSGFLPLRAGNVRTDDLATV